MKRTNNSVLKTKIVILLVLVVLFIVFITSGMLSRSQSTAELRTIFSFDEQKILELEQTDEIKSDVGEVLLVYEDDNYAYYVEQDSKKTVIIEMSIAGMQKLSEEYAASDQRAISEKDARKTMQYVIDSVFPEYNSDNLSISMDSDTGSHLEQYIYTIREMKDGMVLNLASVSIAFNGEVTLVTGTHNTLESSEINSGISSDEAMAIAYDYIMKEKEIVASDTSEEEPVENETIIATEDMVLPDGVKVGDEFNVVRLPKLEYYVDSMDDLHIIEIAKVSYNKRVVWQLEFSIETSWGEVDDVFNPIVAMYIDVETGEILGVDTAG